MELSSMYIESNSPEGFQSSFRLLADQIKRTDPQSITMFLRMDQVTNLLKKAQEDGKSPSFAAIMYWDLLESNDYFNALLIQDQKKACGTRH